MADITMNGSSKVHSTNGINGHHGTSLPHSNAWQSPGPAAFDFRSDVVTTPTLSMLTAIQNTTLLDDVFAEDPTTNNLQSHIADLTAHPAALLVLSGTMGNQVSLRTHLTQPPHSVLCDHRAHILEWEAGGVASLCGALVNGIVPSNGHHLTLKDIEKYAIISDNIHACPTKVISLENTLGGEIIPLEDCQAISTFARAHNIKMHLDGARIWEAVSAQVTDSQHGGSLVQGLQAYCQCFDSVSLCFSKGLGAPIGSMIVGSKAFIKTATHIRKSIGGGLRQAGVVTAAARVAVDETFLGAKLAASHKRAREIGDMWVRKGGKLAKNTETNMCWFDIQEAGWGPKEFTEAGVRYGVKVIGGRVVVHYQIGEEAVKRLDGLMDEVLLKRKGKGGKKEEMSGEFVVVEEQVKEEAEKVRRPEEEME